MEITRAVLNYILGMNFEKLKNFNNVMQPQIKKIKINKTILLVFVLSVCSFSFEHNTIPLYNIYFPIYAPLLARWIDNH